MKLKKYVQIVAVSSVLMSGVAFATPSLQLDILGGSYDATEGVEDVYTTADTFTLYAYGHTTANSSPNSVPVDLDVTHYISVAITPKISQDEVNNGTADFGSFEFAGTTYTASDLVFGNPPVEDALATQPHDGQDLGPHDIYETLFLEIDFKFLESQQRADVNVQDSPGTDPLANVGDELFYYGFSVDTTNMLAGYELHFDLYNTKMKDGDTDINNFAPFSKDASTRPGDECCTQVPEPGTALLLGLGLLGMVRLRNKASA